MHVFKQQQQHSKASITKVTFEILTSHPLGKVELTEYCSGLNCVPHSPGGSDSKESGLNAGDSASDPGSGRSPGAGNGNPLHYSCLWNPMDKGAWWARAAKEMQRVKHHWATNTYTLTPKVRGLSPNLNVTVKTCDKINYIHIWFKK